VLSCQNSLPCTFIRKTYVFMLEQFSSSKKQRCRLLGPKCLSDIEQVNNACQERSAFPRTNWRFIEDSSLLYDCSFVVVIGAEPALVLLFRCERHGGWVLVASDNTSVDVVRKVADYVQPHKSLV